MEKDEFIKSLFNRLIEPYTPLMEKSLRIEITQALWEAYDEWHFEGKHAERQEHQWVVLDYT